MRHQRAIDDVEKIERRQRILQAAGALFETASFDQVSMLEVAHVSGIAKGTVYLYFNTKEELFLALLDEAFGGWFAALEARLVALPQGEARQRISALAAELTESLRQQPRLLRLLPILHTVLEHNVPYPAALEFKQHLRDRLLQTGQGIEAVLAFLKPGQGAELLLHAYAALIGLQSMAQPSVVVRRVLDLPEMAVLAIDEVAALRQLTGRLLTGYYFENERESNETT